jgi:serine/threonine protein phosphatase PrpC
LKQLEKALELTNENLEENILNVNANKDNITIIFAKLEDLRTWCKNQNDMMNGQFKDELAKLKTYFEGQIIE